MKNKNEMDPVDCVKGLISGADTNQKYESIVFAWLNSECSKIVLNAIKAIENENEESKYSGKAQKYRRYKGFQIDQFNINTLNTHKDYDDIENNMIKKYTKNLKPGDEDKTARWHLTEFKDFLFNQIKSLTVDQIKNLTDRSRLIIRKFKENPEAYLIHEQKKEYQKKWREENIDKVRE